MLVPTILIFLLVTRESLQECSIQPNSRGMSTYFCNTIQDLEGRPNSQQLNVTISNQLNPVAHRTRNQTKPNFEIKLNDVGVNRISQQTINLLKSLYTSFKANYHIDALPAGFFSGLQILSLKMNNNGINAIEMGAFRGLTQLATIHVTNNQLSLIKNGVFNSLNVITLNLANNKISFIEKDALKNMKLLVNLHLNGNRLSEFQPEVIMNNGGNIENLWLNDNLISEIDRNLLRTLTNLRRLNLANNKISRIYSYTFENILNLETLILSNNLLRDFDGNALPSEGLTKLNKLFLNNNRLSYLTTTTLEKVRNLKFGSFGGNPWQCPCFDALLSWIDHHRVKQLCDEEYFQGLRPICVADAHTNICTYTMTQSTYNGFSEVNDNYTSSIDCNFEQEFI